MTVIIVSSDRYAARGIHDKIEASCFGFGASGERIVARSSDWWRKSGVTGQHRHERDVRPPGARAPNSGVPEKRRKHRWTI